MKRVISGILIIFMLCIIPISMPKAEAALPSINDSSVFVKQPRDGDGTCVVTSLLNMLRRRAILDGLSDWNTITYSNYVNTITTDGVNTTRESATVKGMTFFNYRKDTYNYVGMTPAQKKAHLISMLKSHPEGVAISRFSYTPHTVLLVDYDSSTDTFYCVETLNYLPKGIMKLTDTYLAQEMSQDDTIASTSNFWIIIKNTNSGGGGSNVCTSHVKGTFEFYESAHPHYNYYSCGNCGVQFTDNSTSKVSGCTSCYPPVYYTVTYNANGGTGAPASQTCVQGSTITIPTQIPTRTGHSFLGWNPTISESSAAHSPGSSLYVNSNITLYAIWYKNAYTISYNGNGGTGAPSSHMGNYDDTIKLSSRYPSRTGYTFRGWSTSSTATEATYAPNGNYHLTGDVTLYAVWSRTEYTINYSANGGTGAPSAHSAYYGDTVSLSQHQPSRTGYTFIGWSTASDATEAEFMPGHSFTISDHVAVYAVWTKGCPNDNHNYQNNCDIMCDDCGKIRETTHEWGEYVYNFDATSEADGTKTRTCESCGTTETITAEGTKLPSEERMPHVVLNADENGVVTEMRGSWATRVYWGYIGTEKIDFEWFDDFRLHCGTEYVADFTPREGKNYYFTKTGYYVFYLKCIVGGNESEGYQYKDAIYSFYYDGKSAPAVPSLTQIDGNTVQINKNGLKVKKLYYGNIGSSNEPYGWFNDFWGKALGTKTYNVDYSVSWDEQYKLPLKGFYNFVVVYEDASGNSHEIVFTFEATQDAPIIKKEGDFAVIDNNAGVTDATVTKLYYAHIGYKNTDYIDFNDFITNNEITPSFGPKDGTKYALTEKGYYRFVVQYSVPRNDKPGESYVYDVIFTVDNDADMVKNLYFNADNGNVEIDSKYVTVGEAVGELPTPTRDYYTFNGWFDENGTQYTADTVIVATEDITLTASWTHNAPSGWVRASEVPADAEVISRKWSYTEREFSENSSSAVSGWINYDKRITSWGAWSEWITWNPSNGINNVESRSVYDHTEYHYYRWTNSNHTAMYTYKTSSYNCTILEETWFTYELTPSSKGYPIVYTGSDTYANRWVRADYAGNYSVGTDYTRIINRTEWRYRDPIYTYYFYRDVHNKEATSNPTGWNNVSNVVEWVQYRSK